MGTDPDRATTNGPAAAGPADPPATRASLAVLLACLVAVAVVPGGVVGAVGTADGPVAGEGANSSEGAAEREVGPLTECFAGEGYPLAIGDPPATIDALVHVSVLTDPRAGDEFGVELAGTLEGDPVVTLAAGVRLDAPGLIATGIDPFAAFDLLYTYELRLPMFDGGIDETTYGEDRPPVGSAAGAVPC
ncbi:hypothetical protein ACFPM1_08845 [Halorubrum rubrum]|uniref:Uncharacterized protein n=1 Tax=Halorubrum rubrum TaxID=1126240 RepID=A0ABD5R1R6_9EURY|nr:hypothetical protein [Halorubrum rubrum]